MKLVDVAASIWIWKKGSAAEQHQCIHAIMILFVDIDILIIDPLLSVNFRTMCQKTLGSGEWDSAQALWKLGPQGSPTTSING